ncbi:MAG: hypothetical protein ACOC1O_00930 [bacterium]
MELKTLIERLIRKKVVRKGKPQIKYVTDKDGYKVKYDSKSGIAKEVRMSPREIRRRMLSAIKASRKRKGKQAQANRKRKLSNNKRTW